MEGGIETRHRSLIGPLDGVVGWGGILGCLGMSWEKRIGCFLFECSLVDLVGVDLTDVSCFRGSVVPCLRGTRSSLCYTRSSQRTTID